MCYCVAVKRLFSYCKIPENCEPTLEHSPSYYQTDSKHHLFICCCLPWLTSFMSQPSCRILSSRHPLRNAQLYIFGLLDSRKCNFCLMVANKMAGIRLDTVLHVTMYLVITGIIKSI